MSKTTDSQTTTLGRTRGSGLTVPAPIAGIAYGWHGGQASMLYAIASTGALTLGRTWDRLVEALDLLGTLWWRLARELEEPVGAGQLAPVWIDYCRDVSAALEDAADQLAQDAQEEATLDAVEAHVSAITACAYAETVASAMAGGGLEPDPWGHANWVGDLFNIAGSELVEADPWSVLLGPVSLESRDGKHVSIVLTSGGPHHEIRWPFGRPDKAVVWWTRTTAISLTVRTWPAGRLLEALALRVDSALPRILDPQETMPDDTPREVMLTLFTAGTTLAEGKLP